MQVAAKYTGDITVLDNVAGMPLLMRAGCFLAADENVQLTTQTQNLSMGLFSGNGMFILEAQGNGPLAFAAFGNVFKRELSEGQEILVDNGCAALLPAHYPRVACAAGCAVRGK